MGRTAECRNTGNWCRVIYGEGQLNSVGHICCLLLPILTSYHGSLYLEPGGVAQLVVRLTQESEVLGSIPGLATYFHLSFP